MSSPATPSSSDAFPSLCAVILAAGKGTRMQSDLPKVAHTAAGKPLVRWVADACAAVGASPRILVTGHRAEVVRSIFAEDFSTNPPAVREVLQGEQLGTGHAVLQAEQVLRDNGQAGGATDCLVLYGDGPLIRPQTLRTLVQRHRATGASATLATSMLEDPTGYGRILRDERGGFRCIREQKDASAPELAVREVNPGYYCFRVDHLLDALHRVGRANASGEIYLTDVFEILLRDGRHVEVVAAVPPEDVLSVNTPEQLRTVEALLLARKKGAPSTLAGAPTGARP